ncbi:phage tail protein [Paenibacillus sp. FSL R5-0407]|uniref:phage tail protein n=1 Tax=Paenibacillus sp. FSL R5-0407 TaxID=2975320 RepID=UPI0030F69D91
MASNTPNLNLLKKDPVTDGNDTFNIRTMLNENWDKIDAAVGEVREELKDIEIPNASLNKAGIVQLSNETSGSRENVAATEKAVSQAFQAGNERKAEVVAALVALGVSASTSETWAQLIPKMASIIRATGNAAAADLLAGKTASNASGPFSGTMPDRGAATITPSGTGAVTIPDGAYKGAKVAQVSVPAAKVLNDTTIAGVKGTIPNRSEDNFHMPGLNYTSWAGDRAFIQPLQGFYNGASWVTAPAPDLLAQNIRAGKNILGIPGTLIPLLTDPETLNITGPFSTLAVTESEVVLRGSSDIYWYDKNGTRQYVLGWAQMQPRYPRAYYSDNDIYYAELSGVWVSLSVNKSGTILKSLIHPTSGLGFSVPNSIRFGAADASNYYLVSNTTLIILDKNFTIKRFVENGFGIYNDAVTGFNRSASLGAAGKVKNNKIYIQKSGDGSEVPGLYIFDLATMKGKAVNVDLAFLMY